MPKVKVVGDLNFEFDVKYNQSEDVALETKGIIVDGKTIYIGKGDITKINPKAFGFTMDRIEYFLKKNGAYILDIYAIKDDIINTIHKEKIEPLRTILNACRHSNQEAIEKMLQDGWFILSADGVKAYADKYFKKVKS